tara:strand:+ start:4005 stop:4601 length:597 start_codon:yes stop_codon:yes gene_type:complete
MFTEMSWRPAAVRAQGRGQLSLLPQFDAPVHMQEFSLEHHPPALPQRVGPLRALSLCMTSVFCMVGALALVGLAAEPATRSGQIIAQNVRSVVGDAIAHANDAAEAQRRAQAASRVKYIQRRGLATVPQAPAKRSVPPSLLFRLAAIRKAEESALDEDLVAQLFPMWKTEDGWNQSEVLKDLILAVSHLAYIAEASGV